MDATAEACKDLLYQALRQDIGILVQVTDFARARQALYRARADANDPELTKLQFRVSPGLSGGNLIIIKETIQLRNTNQSLADL